ncbi:glycosyltransferase family 2 protein [Zunongwangia sp. F260]|uniref:Glycosyltransferase family 2 protein n=1 Tax=Autumnicola lenta TaxID=3075593 RepID=A0ABU3CG54_9FLAO|nr:glycosyltransferase family 2 protein [Zunongwangia sp. F260]MDT0645314.1 glycosyltransferase family 2 protein [Zunongwangia sp. F260]
MEKYCISIIIPNYNHASFLERRLETVFEQTLQNFEVILLDDCSTDQSREILSKYKKHPKTSHCIFNKKNIGSPFKQWEKGIKLAKGDFIWIAEADDFCESNFLEETIKPLMNDDKITVSYCQSSRANFRGVITGNWITHTNQFSSKIFNQDFTMHGNVFIEKFLIHKNVIPNVSAVIFRKSHLEKILPLSYEPYQKYNADWYYYVQLLCNSKVAFISKSLNHFRYHENSVISRAGGESGWIKIFKMELKVRKKMVEYLEKCKPSNLEEIKFQSEIGNKKLYYLIAKGFVKENKHFKGISTMLNKPDILKKILKYSIKHILK